MSDPNASAKGLDWTRLLADPDLVTHLAELLQAYRVAPPANREQALVEAMRAIKTRKATMAQEDKKGEKLANSPLESGPLEPGPLEPVKTEAANAPPFEPSMFTPSPGTDRRRYPRMKCFVVVELRAEGSEKPSWGNLANTSLGGCFVETPAHFSSGAKIEIGLWVSSGQIWIKGLVLNGVVARSSPSYGIRIKFAGMDPVERESLRQFLKFVENSTKGYAQDHGYLAQLKR